MLEPIDVGHALMTTVCAGGTPWSTPHVLVTSLRLGKTRDAPGRQTLASVHAG